VKSGILNCKQVNEIDLVEYLSKLGHEPQKVRNNDYWYLSPLREEQIASFKVNRKLNLWYDHGIGKGGTLVDFGVQYHKCSVKVFLKRIAHENGLIIPFQPQLFNSAATEKKTLQEQAGKIKILSNELITDTRLLRYLYERQIPREIAAKFCEQVCFELYNKKHLAIGFKNNTGGYELRNHYFKGSSSPKQPVTFKSKIRYSTVSKSDRFSHFKLAVFF
jgi:CHC2 zinc finger